jgi:hypothetical protein
LSRSNPAAQHGEKHFVLDFCLLNGIFFQQGLLSDFQFMEGDRTRKNLKL